MAETGINTDAVYAGLRAVKSLRCSVRDLFKTLAEGDPLSVQNSCNQSQPDGQQPDNQDNKYVNDLQAIILNMNNKVRELESSCTLLAHVPNTQMTLGNSGLLGQDMTYERSLLYTSMVTSYRWIDKVSEYANHGYHLLNQNSLKRTNFQSNLMNSMGPNRGRFTPQTLFPRRTTGHNIPMNQVDNFCMLLQGLSQDMGLEIMRPFGAAAVLKISLDKTLKAVILLRGLIIEWVMVKGFYEDMQTEDGKIDIWSESRYEVFRKVSDHANAAMLHFYSPIRPELALRSFVTWIHSYSNLFSKACRKCNRRLLYTMPPTWRDFRNLEPYHELCRP